MTAELQIFEEPFAIERVVDDMLLAVRDINVTDAASFSNITAYYAKAKEWLDLIDFKRKEASAPARKIVSLINERAKDLAAPLEEVAAIANQKALAWQTSERQRLEREAQLLDITDVPALKAETAHAQFMTRSTKRYRIVDLKAVPERYLRVDEDAVLRDLKLGVNEIAGLEIYTEESTTLRRK